MNGIQENQKLESAQNVNQRIGTKKELTQKRVKELLSYDPETGVFIWNICRNRLAPVGGIAGADTSNGYRRIVIGGREYLAHRVAWFYMEGYWPEHEIDHINRVKNDNRWKNLRHVSRQCNLRNQKLSYVNKSGVTGLCHCGRSKKWHVAIGVGGKSVWLGDYKSKHKAAMVRWEAEKKYNFPNCNTISSAYKYLKEEGRIK